MTDPPNKMESRYRRDGNTQSLPAMMGDEQALHASISEPAARSPVEHIDEAIAAYEDAMENWDYGSPRWCASATTVVALYALRKVVTR